jgi:cytidylate kinase
MSKIITISGNLGSGKSTVGALLANALDYEIYSVGDIVRRLASYIGMSINEYNDFIKDKPEYDKKVDDEIVQLALIRENLIFVSRAASFFVPKSFKVFLHVDEMEGAKRIISDKSRIGEHYDGVEDALSNVHKRFESARKRFMENYGIDIKDSSHYDLYLDTTHLSVEEVLRRVIEGYNKYLNLENLEREAKKYGKDIKNN